MKDSTASTIAPPIGGPAAVTAGASDGARLDTVLAAHRIERRTFLKYCATIAGALAIPAQFAPRIARALAAADKPSLVWLEFQDCAGNTESFLRAGDPGVADVILDLLSIDYHEVIMAAAGVQAEAAKQATLDKGGYLVVVEGAIPLGENGAFCTIGGRSAEQILREAAEGAAAIITVGTCASFGGIPQAAPNPTSAAGVGSIVSGVPIINLPGCPANADNMVATIAHFLTFGSLPATDGEGRPLFAYGDRIHDSCERRAHFDAGQFAVEWGDEGHRKGWCLYRMGCKGPSTFHNCSTIRWNGGTNWPVGAGHGCVGCSEPGFWDTMTPIYGRLPNVAGFGVETSADRIGLSLVAATAVAFGAHGVAKAVQRQATGRGGPPSTEPAGQGAEPAPPVVDPAEEGEA